MNDLPGESRGSDTRIQDKEQAHEFLKGLERELQKLSPAPKMEYEIRGIVAAHQKKGYLGKPEAAFLNGFVIPRLAEQVRSYPACVGQNACKAVLCENHPNMSDFASGPTASKLGHPFTKVIGAKPTTIYGRWTDTKKALAQSWPDFALRSPFPHKIVFEGKYFSEGSLQRAREALVTDIYQAFFYRGLPFVKADRVWDYDYACLLAYDASPKGTLKKAWEDLPQKVRQSFWEGLNIYVMILGGQGRPTK
jgi:hypothetical protein